MAQLRTYSGNEKILGTLNVVGAVDLDSTLVVGGNIEASTIVQTTLTGNALRVLRNLASTSTDSPLVELVQDHASDDQPALKIQQDATGTNVSALDIICANATYQLMRSAGVAHGMTGVVPTDVLGRISAQSLTAGGLAVRGFTDSDALALFLIGTSGSATPTVAPVMILGQKYDGATGATTLAATEPLVAIATSSGSPLITVYGNGDIDALKVKPGTSTDNAKVGGVLLSSTTQTGNVGTGEDPLLDFALPANALAVNGQSIVVYAWGTFANNANSKRLRFRFGTAGTNLVLDTTALSNSAVVNWELTATVIRTGAATQKGICKITVSDPAFLNPDSQQIGTSTALNQTLSGAVTIRISGEATANNDILIEACKIWWEGENT